MKTKLNPKSERAKAIKLIAEVADELPDRIATKKRLEAQLKRNPHMPADRRAALAKLIKIVSEVIDEQRKMLKDLEIIAS